ncbi:MAG TPA: DUF169 domain-containing protein [Methanomassiliicoccales archaeon]|nr:DUF169 domain-containing protein [Methanomassiliicoccales archaeon]HPR97685.1 DUF169 domain-containing protein [Methanomassiliicoccales archaeon]HSA35273.1 DUF169 domain-containing protein [Methanomassiliicoccales archaeon]
MGSDGIDITEIGKVLGTAGHLALEPLCVFESELRPRKGRPFGEVDRCIAKAVLMCAQGKEELLYIGEDARSGICPGGQSWMGLAEMAEGLKFFISTGSPSFRHGEAEYLKRDPEMVLRSKALVGRIRPPEKYLVVTQCRHFRKEDGLPRALLLFVEAEQLRNLLSLHHFGTPDAFTSTCAPWGPSCASFLTYPAGLASNCPDQALIVGPVDPTGNSWMPPNLMSLGLKVKDAERMVRDIPSSFLSRRPQVAFPDGR